MLRTRAFTLGLLVLVASLPRPALAQWQLDGVPVCTESSFQSRPALVPSGGGAFVVWTDNRTDPSRIRAQRLNGAGEAMWPAGGIEISPTGAGQSNSAAVSDGVGGIIVTYLQSNSGTQTDVRAQRVDATGASLWGTAGVGVCTEAGTRFTPAIVSDERSDLQTPGAIIAWRDLRSVPGRIYAQAIRMSGAARWATVGGVPVTGGFDHGNFVMVGDGIGGTNPGPKGVIVAFEDQLFVSSKQILAQRFDYLGVAQWGFGVTLGSGATSQTFPSIAYLAEGTALVAWTDLRNSNVQIYAQKVANNSTAWAPTGVPVCPPTTNQTSVTVVPDGAGGGMLSFLDTRAGTRGVYAQRINGDGTLHWANDGVLVANVETYAQFLVMVPSTAGSAIIGWDDTRADGAPGLHAQKVDATGTVLWNPNGAPVCVSAHQHTHPRAIADSTGGAIFAWEDLRVSGTDFDIYANRIDGGGGLVAVDPPGNTSLQLSSPFPNPGMHRVAFRLDLQGPGAFTARVFDLHGRHVATIAHGRADAGGSRQLVWERRTALGERAPAGVYFLQVLAGEARSARRFVLLD